MPDGLLLIHAWPTDSRIWERQADALGGRVQVVAPNLPGFGGAEPAGDAMTMAAGAERCLAELDRAGIDRAVVCGLLLGGYVAFELWRRAPDRFAGFVLANTRAVADSEEAAANRRGLAGRLLAEGTEFFLADPPPLLSEHAPDDLRARLRSIIADQPAASIAAALLGMAERPDSTPDLPGIDVPTLVITSELDALVPSEASLAMAALIPNASSSILGRVGHLTNLEASDEFTELLGNHLSDCGVG
jgi:pimeloyl-ACP methyl ester carboxylesterase